MSGHKQTVTSAEIGAHGAIGNMRSIALVSTAGTIDYLCHPYLDSPSVFCALLDPDAGGAFSIAPDGPTHWHTRQIYIPDTNVLITASWTARPSWRSPTTCP